MIVLRALVAAALALGGTAAHAECDAAIIRSASGPQPYASRPEGHCEGTYSLPVAAPFELLSFTVGSIRLDPSGNWSRIAAPLSPSDRPLDVRVRSRSGTYGYRMDVRMDPALGFRWPLRIVRDLGLVANDIGAFGIRRSGSAEQVVPVSVGANQNSAEQRLVVRLIAPQHLSGPVEYSLVTPGGANPEWRTVTTRGPNKGEVVTIVLPGGSLEGERILRVRARSRLDASLVSFSRTLTV
jgi:hypothetical protein